MSLNKVNRILITGPPGIGKTTVIQNVYNILKAKNIPLQGFYTKEVRNNNFRIGFDVVTLDGQTGILARLKDGKQIVQSCVGNYAVLVNEFESLVIPTLTKKGNNNVIFIIDEIGKMELFSKKFEEIINNLFTTPNITIIATIPITKHKPIPFIEKLKCSTSTLLITVDRNNRNNVPVEIVNFLKV